MKRHILIGLLVVLLMFGCTKPEINPQTKDTTPAPGGTVQPPISMPQARLYVSLSDPGNVLGNITKLEMTVSKISIHAASNQSWITLFEGEKVFDLLALKASDVKELAAQQNLAAGKYTQLRVDITKVSAIYNGLAQDVKLPSNSLKLKLNLDFASEDALLNLDFLANESFHATGDGKLIMTPVINLEKHEGVKVENKGKNITIKEEKKLSKEQHGMSENGTMEQGKKLRGNESLEIGADGKVKKKDSAVNGTESSGKGKPQNNQTQAPKNQTNGKGKAIVTVKDKAPANNSTSNKTKVIKTEGGLNVTLLDITISSVKIHSASNASWITISNLPMTFSMFELQNVEALLGEVTLPAGKYTQISVNVTKATAIINGNEVDLKVPSSTLKLNGVLDVGANQTSVATIDFIVERSIIQSGDSYKLKPVIKLTIKSDVTVKSKVKVMDKNYEKVTYDGGQVVEETEFADTSA